jgi:hypothetical protein
MGLEFALRIVSCMSMVCSLSVVITCSIFSSMRKSFFTRNIMMIALCDVFVSIAGMIGAANDGTRECQAQAFLSTFFLRGNWIWTTALICQMHRFVTRDGEFFSEGKVHAIVWSITAFMTFGPLADGSFGHNGLNDGTELCFIRSSSRSWEAAWAVIDWSAAVFLCIVVMAVLISSVLFQYRAIRNDVVALKILNLTRSLYVYPLVLAATWGINTMLNLVIMFMVKNGKFSATETNVLRCSLVSAMTNGILLAIVFYAKSHEARYQWKRTLFCLPDTRKRVAVQSSHQTTAATHETHAATTYTPALTASTRVSISGGRISNFDFDETTESFNHLKTGVEFIETRNSSLHENLNSVL